MEDTAPTPFHPSPIPSTATSSSSPQKQIPSSLAEAMAERGVPHHIRSDNGPEFIARDVQDWLAEMGICTIYIDPGSPWQNGHVEPSGAR